MSPTFRYSSLCRYPPPPLTRAAAQGLLQVAGNGHFNLSTKDGTFPDSRKPNSTGADWTAGRLAELFQILLDMLGILDRKQNLQAPLNCMGWTPASIPLLTNATITDGQIESLPDPTLGLRSLIATEIRGDSKSMLIRGVFPRNSDGQEQFMVCTFQPRPAFARYSLSRRRSTRAIPKTPISARPRSSGDTLICSSAAWPVTCRTPRPRTPR